MTIKKIVEIKPEKSHVIERMRMEDNKNLQSVSSLCRQVEQKKNMSDVIEILNKFKSQNKDVIYNEKNGSYVLENYYIVPGMYTDDCKSFVKNLKTLNRLGLCRTSAPEIIDIAQNANNDFAVFVYKINDTKGGILLPYLQKYKQVPIEKKEQFLQEQKALLLNTAKYNPAVLKSFDCWGVTPDTYNIFIDSWNELTKSMSKEEQSRIIQHLEEILLK